MKFEKFNNKQNHLDKKKFLKSDIFEYYIKKAEKLLRIGVFACALGGGLFFINKNIEDHREYQQYCEIEYSKNKTEILSLEKEVEKIVGKEVVDRIKKADLASFVKNKTKEKKYNLDIDGFDKLNISADILNNLLSENNGSYPKKWIYKEIKGIKYVDKEVFISENGNYNSKLKNKPIAGSSSYGFIYVYKQNFFDKSKQKDILEFLDLTLAHELAHNNDWETDSDINLKERLELFLMIVKRMNAYNHFRPILDMLANKGKPDYEFIENDNIYLKAKEYWGYLCTDYFIFPELIKQLFPEDFKLVDQYIKKNDPNFNVFEARNKRLKIIENINNIN